MKARKYTKYTLVLILVLLIVLATPVVCRGLATPALARAQSPAQGSDLPDISQIEQYVAAVGVGALIMLAIEILKKFGVVPDGQAGTWAAIANVVMFAVLYVAGVFGFDPLGEGFQGVLAVLNEIGKLILMLGSTFGLFTRLRAANVPMFRKAVGRR